jgi:prefoldin subunit 2
VIETLKELEDQKRKCYRMVGGVLVERTVAEVQVSLDKNKEMVINTFERLVRPLQMNCEIKLF